MFGKVMVTVGVLIVVMMVIVIITPTIQTAHAYTTIELARIEMAVAQARVKTLELGQTILTEVKTLSTNTTKVPELGGKMIGLAVATAYVGGGQTWEMLRTVNREYAIQLVTNRQTESIAQIIGGALAIKTVNKILEAQTTIPEGRVLTGVYNGMTTQEVLAPLQNLTAAHAPVIGDNNN